MDGVCDFTLDFKPDVTWPSPLGPALILAAVRDQLRLAVKSERAPIDFRVIDTVEKVAAGN
jgi:uncharacterized protein (TIGR03435 family)